jgi:hypothetical protein
MLSIHLTQFLQHRKQDPNFNRINIFSIPKVAYLNWFYWRKNNQLKLMRFGTFMDGFTQKQTNFNFF